MRHRYRPSVLLLLVLSCLWWNANGQFGTPKRKAVQIDAKGNVQDSDKPQPAAVEKEIELDIHGNPMATKWSTEWVIQMLQKSDPTVDEETAQKVAAVIGRLDTLPDHPPFNKAQAIQSAREFARTMTPTEIVQNLLKAVESMKYVEAIFLAAETYPEHQDAPFEQMKAAHMIPVEREEEFRTDTPALKEHMRVTAQHSLMCLAMAGGFLPGLDDDKPPKKTKRPTKSSNDDKNAGTATADYKVLEKLRKQGPDLDEQIIKDMAAIIYSAQHNEGQRELRQLALDKKDDILREIAASGKTDWLDHLINALEGLKRVDDIFEVQEPSVILGQMKAAGLIDAQQQGQFENDPKSLQDHVRSTAYFTLMTLAFAGDLMTVDVEEEQV